MLIKYYLSDNIKAPFENFALASSMAWIFHLVCQEKA